MSALTAALRLRAELESLAGALTTADETLLVAIEARLATAVAELSQIASVDAVERTNIRMAVRGARAALLRCRILGSAITDTTRATLIAQGHVADYDQAGHAASQYAPRGIGVDARL